MPSLVGLSGGHAGGVQAVQQDGAASGLIHLGQQVEHGGLARAVGADETGDLGAADGQVEVIHGGQAAEVDAQVAGLQNGALVNVPLRDLCRGWAREPAWSLLFVLIAGTPPLLCPSGRILTAMRCRTALALRVVGDQHDQDQHDGVDQHTVIREARAAASGRTVSTAAAMMEPRRCCRCRPAPRTPGSEWRC